MHTHLIKKCEENHVGMVEVVLFHITIAFLRSGWLLVTLFIYFEEWLAPRYLILFQRIQFLQRI